jgi:hypothetical protein
MNSVSLVVIIIAILLLLYILKPRENFISYSASYSEYGPQPLAILTKYVENKMDYYELEQKTKHLMVMEVFKDSRYKLYSDNSLVYEGYLKADDMQIVNDLIIIADKHDGKVYCPAGLQFTKYKLWLNGRNIYLGLFGENCTPLELQAAKKLFKLMEVSDISSYA